MKAHFLCVVSFTVSPLVAVACGSSKSHFDNPAPPGSGGASGGGSDTPSAGAGSGGSSGAAAPGGAAGEGTNGAEAGSGASTAAPLGGEGGGGPCASAARRCDGEQPQVCADGQWQDDGELCVAPESCNGAAGSCDASLAVPGGEFLRSDTDPASVSDFRLERYEVTVGEFRGFVAAAIAGYRPAPGSGKHSHLNGGMGLANSGSSGGYEAGWDSGWDAELLDSAQAWNAELECNLPSSWTAEPGENESLPINCVSWYHAYAYCIWTGGFLPSEAEWNYAAAGGDEQRPFPWGSQEPDATRVVYGVSQPAEGGSRPDGDGRWGQSELAGNLMEWTLDRFAEYETPCVDCAYLDGEGERVLRGGGYINISADSFRTAYRGHADPSGFLSFGFRCARAAN